MADAGKRAEKHAEPAASAPARESGDAPAPASKGGALWATQRSAGNAAAGVLVQRWKKAAPTQAQPPAQTTPWTKASPTSAPATTGPAAWTKAAPTATIGPAPAPMVAPGAAGVSAVQAHVAAARAAAGDAASAAKAAADNVATAMLKQAEAQAASTAAQADDAAAVPFWQSEEPGSGGKAAKQAAKVDASVTTGEVSQQEVVTQAKAVDLNAGLVTTALAAIAAAGRAAALVKDVPAAGAKAGGARAGAAGRAAVAAAQQAAVADLKAIKQAAQLEQKAVAAAKVAVAKEAATTAQHLAALATSQKHVWGPLQPGGGPAVIIGRMQQQLNGAGASPRLSITAQFSDRTKAALVAFQGAGAGAGRADEATWAKLDAKAPAIKQAGQWVVERPGGATPMGTSFVGFGAGMEGLDRPIITNRAPTQWWEQVALVKTGPAVTELQQRLDAWLGTLDLFDWLMLPNITVSGTLDGDTVTVLKEFQAANKLKASGETDRDTWRALDKVAAKVTEGAGLHQELTETEGQERGQVTRYGWKMVGDRLEVRVKIHFDPADPRTLKLVDTVGFPALKKDPKDPTKVDPSEVPMLQARMQSAIARWKSDISRVWDGFTAKDVSPGSKAKPVPISFVPEAVTSGGDAKVQVLPAATADNPGARSNAAQFYAVDTSTTLAAHEFGHLVGLPDEYGLREEHFTRVTGTEAQIGSVTPPTFKDMTAAQHADYIAGWIGAASPVADAGDPATPAVKAQFEAARGKVVAFNTAVANLGLDTFYHAGAFNRAVSEAFAEAPGSKAVSGGKDIPSYVVGLVAGLDALDPAKGTQAVWQIQALYERGIRGFLSSNKTIMGASATVPEGPQPLVMDHTHPVQARHVQPFAKHIGTALGGSWKVT